MEQFDITEFTKMFDAALASDNPAVQKALRNFMMVAAIVHAQELDAAERIMGPLETLVKKVGDLERMVYEIHTKQMTQDSYKDYYGNNPTWIATKGTSYTYKPYSNSSASSSTSFADKFEYRVEDLHELMKDLKIK